MYFLLFTVCQSGWTGGQHSRIVFFRLLFSLNYISTSFKWSNSKTIKFIENNLTQSAAHTESSHSPAFFMVNIFICLFIIIIIIIICWSIFISTKTAFSMAHRQSNEFHLHIEN